MKILITGAEGFIGSHLADYLESSHELILWDKKNGHDLNEGRNYPDVDTVIHLAAQTDVAFSLEWPLIDSMHNILATIKLAQAYPNNTKIIYAGSAASLGKKISSPYGLSKKTGADYIKLLCKDYVICNFPNVFGKGGKGVVDKFLEADVIKINGDGEQTRDFVYVGDICEALARAITWPKGEYFLGSSKAYKIIELAKITGKPIKFGPPLLGELHDSIVENTAFDNWKPKVDVLDYITNLK